jgi:hypothetical protein
VPGCNRNPSPQTARHFEPPSARIDVGTRRVFSADATKARLAELGMQPLLAGPQAFTEYQRREIEEWVGLVRRAGITAE